MKPAKDILGKLSGALLDQAMLSAGSLLVSLILIRRCADHEYGYYVLATNAILLLVTLQGAFFGGPLVNALTRLPEEQHGHVVSGLYQDQARYTRTATGLLMGAALLAWLSRWTSSQATAVISTFALLPLAMLHREFFRSVMIARRRTYLVLAADAAFVLVMLLGAWLASFSTAPAAMALLTMTLAALLGGRVLSRWMRNSGLLGVPAESGTLRRLAPLGLWAAAGCAIHWTFSQGYSYLVAGTLSLDAVAGIAAVRLLMMPLNLLSSGGAQLLLPTAARWLHDHGASVVFRRLLLLSSGFLLAAVAYFGVIWLLRDWIFGSLMHKDFAQRDLLLCLWGGIFALMVARDQMIYLPVLADRFRELAMLALGCALLALAISYPAMRAYGAPGALSGMLIGEAANLLGITLFALRETRAPQPARTLAGSAA